MPFKNREEYNAYMRKYRHEHPYLKKTSIKISNRLGYLESEVQCLQKSLEVALRGSAMS
jgi:hypothetical protein